MSMHLVGPYMTTTSYKKRKAKKKSKKQLEADAKHEKWLRKMNAHPEQIARKKETYGSDIPIRSIPDYSSDRTSLPTSDVIPGGSTARSERQIYSGERRLLGIATMHKSNMVPVFDTKDAKDIAKMRRG